MAMIHEITAQVGAHKRRKRIGRGPGSGTGKTAGRGHKGAKSRSGWSGSVHPLYEGGQMPYFRRIPKRGFSNVQFATNWAIVNIKTLEARFADGDSVDAAVLARLHLIPNDRMPLKVLGEGELTKKLNVSAGRFSAAAKAKIEGAGGTATVIGGEPPAKPAKPAKPAPAEAAAPAPAEPPAADQPDAGKDEQGDQQS